MHTKSHLNWIFILSVLTLIVLSCALPGSAGSKPPEAPNVNVNPTASNGVLVASGDQFVLTLPDGKKEKLNITTCAGVGSYLQLTANNTSDATDPKRIQVSVSGNNKGPGKYENMFIAVIMGTNDKSVFSGNNPKARVALETDGSGSFVGESIVNISNDPAYTYSTTYKFSGEWKCK
jgi:hypothetical protein